MIVYWPILLKFLPIRTKVFCFSILNVSRGGSSMLFDDLVLSSAHFQGGSGSIFTHWFGIWSESWLRADTLHWLTHPQMEKSHLEAPVASSGAPVESSGLQRCPAASSSALQFLTFSSSILWGPAVSFGLQQSPAVSVSSGIQATCSGAMGMLARRWQPLSSPLPRSQGRRDAPSQGVGVQGGKLGSSAAWHLADLPAEPARGRSVWMAHLQLSLVVRVAPLVGSWLFAASPRAFGHPRVPVS